MVYSMTIGIKFIPLRTPGGELIPGSGLFVQIKKTATATIPEMSGRRVKNVCHISRQEAIDLEDGDDHTILKDQEREISYSGGRRNEKERDQKGQQLNSQAEGSFTMMSAADSSFISNPQRTVVACAEVYSDTR